MVPYYKELETLDNYPIYLKKRFPETKVDVLNAFIPESFYDKYKDLFKQAKVLEQLSKTVLFEFKNIFTHADWKNMGETIAFIKEIEDILEEEINGNNRNYNITLYNLLKSYIISARALTDIFPNYKKELEYIEAKAKQAITDLSKYTEIKIEKNPYVRLNWPNDWYITPSNYLYNDGKDLGRKSILSEKFKKLEFIPLENEYSQSTKYNYNDIANEILKKEYVSEDEFRGYSFLIYNFINIKTPEVELDIARLEKFRDYITEYKKTNDITMEKQVELEEEYFKNNYPEPVRSYQKNIITLTVGFYKALNDFDNSLYVLNNSKRSNIVKELLEMCDNDKNAFLVRFCGFSKIETTESKTITTSRLTVFDDFKEYLEKGWNINLISPIIYDKYKDNVEELPLDSYIISRYLDKQENIYKGKVKIKA